MHVVHGGRALIATGLLLSACAVDSTEPPEASLHEPVPDDTVFQEITVTVGPDGVAVSDPRPITAGEQRAQNEQKAALARGEPVPLAIASTSCSLTSFWFYDRFDWTGNRICFAGAGEANLASYIRMVFALDTWWFMNWSIQVGSYWAGIEAGYLRGNDLTAGPYTCDALPCEIRCDPWNRCYHLFSAYGKRAFSLIHPFDTLVLE